MGGARAGAASTARQQPVLSVQAARALGATVELAGVVAVPSTPPTAEQEDRLRAAVLAVAPEAVVRVERGYQDNYRTGLLVLLAASALLVLGASGIATGSPQRTAGPTCPRSRRSVPHPASGACSPGRSRWSPPASARCSARSPGWCPRSGSSAR